MNSILFNYIIIMISGYVHQVRIVATDWEDAKDKEMMLVKTMMEIDFWRQVNHTMIIRISPQEEEPAFSTDYAEFLKEVVSMRRGQ